MATKFTALQNLDMMIRAKYPIIIIETPEEARAMAAIKQIAVQQSKSLYVWSISQGMAEVNLDDEKNNLPVPDTQDPMAAFRAMIEMSNSEPRLFVMKDLHNIVNGPSGSIGDLVAVRWLRDIAASFTAKPFTLILLSPAFAIPADLTKDVARLDWALPTTAELETLLTNSAKTIASLRKADGKKVIVDITNGKRERVVKALQGLTQSEAENVLSLAVVANQELGESAIPFILNEKKQIIAKGSVLEYYETDVTQEDIGGLALLKQYTANKRRAFSKEAEAYGLPTPKGFLMVGVPGGGKSLTAKASTGGVMPLLRLDVGSLMGSLLGQSEANTRNALRVAEAAAPCVLWIDEIEKAFAGMTGSGAGDSGVSKRILGTILTWMEERKAPVFVVATANDVSALPPELLQRFDDLFFVDLPNRGERAEIVAIHLRMIKRDPAKFDVAAIVEATEGFTGREIKKVIEAGMTAGFADGAREIETVDILQATREIVPTSRTKAEQLTALRQWAATRARPASAPEVKQAVSSGNGRDIEL